MNTRAYSTLHLDTNLSKGTACSKKWYGCKWTQVTVVTYKIMYMYYNSHGGN